MSMVESRGGSSARLPGRWKDSGGFKGFNARGKEGTFGRRMDGGC